MTQPDYDVIILGTGPAGLQAAVHAARAKVSVLVLGRGHKSSLYRAHVENYCCLSGVSGQELLAAGRSQAEAAGVDFVEEDVLDLEPEGEGYLIRTESGAELRGRALILAMGVSRNKLGVPGEKELLGKGVSYCVDCDAGFYRDQPVAVVGSESAALAGALTMLFYASQVHLVAGQLQAADRLAEQVQQSAVEVKLGRQVARIHGQAEVEELVLDDGTSLKVKGVFIELGAKGALQLAAKLGVRLDSETMRYIEADKKQATNLPGVFAAGDICGPPWQMAKAVGEGCVAGLEAAAYAKRQKRQE